jgi:hypothetical protein
MSTSGENEKNGKPSSHYWKRWYLAVFLFLLFQIVLFYFITYFFANYNYTNSY